MAKISVIVPVFNVEKFLPDCLDSLVKQTFKDIEIICIDDVSNDKSLEIIENYAKNDSRIIVLKNDKNSGVSATRNKGLKVATGTYISFVDPDDVIATNTYEKVINYIDKKTGFVIWNSDFITENSEKIGNNVKYDSIGKIKLDSDRISKTNLVLWNKLYKKSIIDEFDITFDEGGKLFEDSGFTLKYISHVENAYYMNDIFYHYRKRQDSLTKNLSEQKVDKYTYRLRSMEDVFDHYNKYNLVEKYKLMFTRLFSNCLIQDFQNCPLERKVSLMDEAIALCKKIGIQVFG